VGSFEEEYEDDGGLRCIMHVRPEVMWAGARMGNLIEK